MEILFISCDFGMFDIIDCGAANRSTLFVHALSQIGHVDVISFYKDKVSSNISNCDVVYSSFIETPKEQSKYKRRFELIRFLISPLNPYSYYTINKNREYVVADKISKKHYDIIACRYIGDAASCGLFKYRNRLVIDVDDNLKSAFLRESAYLPSSSHISIIIRKIRAYAVGLMSKRVLSKVRTSFFSNIQDSPYKNSVYLPNATNIRPSLPMITATTPMRILVVGWMIFLPNIDGVKHFINNIFPLVLRKFPTAELNIVGQISKENKSELEKNPGVRVLGYVPNIVHEYECSRVIIVPLFQGAGTSVKFIEGAAMKRPIVSTFCGKRGLDYAFQNGVDYLLADDDNDFAEKINYLLSSEEKSNEMANRAFQKVNKFFSPEVFIETVKSAVLNNSHLNK